MPAVSVTACSLCTVTACSLCTVTACSRPAGPCPNRAATRPLIPRLSENPAQRHQAQTRCSDIVRCLFVMVKHPIIQHKSSAEHTAILSYNTRDALNTRPHSERQTLAHGLAVFGTLSRSVSQCSTRYSRPRRQSCLSALARGTARLGAPLRRITRALLFVSSDVTPLRSSQRWRSRPAPLPGARPALARTASLTAVSWPGSRRWAAASTVCCCAALSQRLRLSR